ncbi:Protein NLP3 [Raphanus sativus]|nr:Protein NLP3 [Raphanus sativus]
MEEIINSGMVDFPENFMDQQLLWEEEVSVWSSLGLKERVTCAMGQLQEVMGGEKELLVQPWVPVERERRRVVSTEKQPFSLNLFSQSQSLALYRDISADYSFAAEVGSDELVGLPGPVFLNRIPEWTPDVRLFRNEEYQVRASFALPLCHALQAFDLRSSETSIVPTSLKPHTDDLHREVASILKGICISYGLPLAITWGHQQGSCLSAIVSACYASDQKSRSFLSACSEHHLLAKEGIAGTAFATKKQYFAKDVAILSYSYPLSHYAKMFDLHAALAIPLLTRCSRRTVQFVLEFFFPRDSLINQRLILDSLASQLILRFQRSPNLMVDDQLAEEFTDTHTALTIEESPCMSHKGKGKHVSVSWSGEVREPSLSFSLGSRKRKTRGEKDITLDILKQHFAGSLKDAAKNIGVCPTTLKRICRQHGIARWPSRKIKKVGHSLRKLKVVMDSVQGVQGSHHLASFYSSFPQLQSSSSLPLPLLDPTKSVHNKSPHPSSSSSSGSSTCCSSEEKQLVGGCFHKPSQLQLSSLRKDEQRAERVTSSLPPLPSAKEDGIKVNAMFGESKMRMSLKHHWGIGDLRREIAKRFGMDVTSNFRLKYMDDDDEWVLLTGDADLEECIQIYKSSLYKETAVRISVSSLL